MHRLLRSSGEVVLLALKESWMVVVEMDGLWWSNHHLVGGAVLVGGAHTSSVPTSTSLRTPTPSLMRGDHPVFGTGLITRIFVQRRKPVQAQSTPFKFFNPMLT